jgi:hypothetical protein
MDARHLKSGLPDFSTKIAEIGNNRFRLLAAILRDAVLRTAPQDEGFHFFAGPYDAESRKPHWFSSRALARSTSFPPGSTAWMNWPPRAPSFIG